ncbi:DUF805 domain-containing protein [Alteriqipengyuania lutimaris]|uniref:DUF805 domain-containing protein n=1 Tax=Alteriqipengyuania lutimaris TaxID=1538146 RepID=A0A395LJJ8_9SPHN|nr:DUF805 domain-containing protein [Alteriqipengyuania lutimaris]MBB3033887.1 uncharacterized membrane protein YhaH (DUF805 family) [Alteriqipengyuania lutimaris]RDS77148.1 DUF805 domain-containing protein [Alteriqipengyuania lutimaris]
MRWMILPFRRYFDFEGRSRRREYWAFTLLNILVTAVLATLIIAVSYDPGRIDPVDAGTPFASLGALFGVLGLLILGWWLAVLIPSIAVTVRRLHDRDMSGWWYPGLIVLGAIPMVGLIASIALLVMMLLPGTEGPNRFGPSPKSEVSAEVFS